MLLLPQCATSHPTAGRPGRAVIITFALAFALAFALTPLATAAEPYEREPINYWTTPLTDPVTRLKQNLESGDLQLDATTELSWLRGVLAALRVPESSQVLVFSKTSLQRSLISPSSPRALYFNDEVYVGWVPGGAIELTAMDPQVGAVFYLLHRPPPPDPLAAAQTPPRHPSVIRDQECLSCHAGPMTGNIPGLMIRSVYPDAHGNPIFTAGTKLTGHHSPLEQRWGGWYVTGHHDPMRHLGNAIATETPQGANLNRDAGANLTSLARHFDVSRYLLDQSDLVALMVLEHQINLHTLMTQAHYAVDSALHRDEAMRRELPEASTGDSTRRIITHEATRLVKNMLFADETPLSPEGVSGSPTFVADFTKTAPRDHAGQSLKTLHLGSRLFKNRCSYLVYSPSFDALPTLLHQEIARLLHDALVRHDPLQLANHLRPEEKSRLVQILRETKPSLTRDW
jgi:2-hydroxychromene-2-carboxylate isomerase